MKKLLIPILILLIIAGAGYWYFGVRPQMTDTTDSGGDSQQQGGFSPFGRTPTDTTGSSNAGETPTGTSTEPISDPIKLPVLRLLSDTPIGGYGASTTASTTVVRWVDRGRGNVYEARGDSLKIITLSNTIVPKIVQSVWGAGIASFVATAFNDGDSATETIYADIKARPVAPVASTTATGTPSLGVGADGRTVTPFELKGKKLPSNIVAYAASPRRDRLFMFVDDGGTGVGYVSTFDGRNVTQIFTTPITQVSVDWPEEGTIAIQTRGTASQGGYLYFVDPKSGSWEKILGPIIGLSTRVSTNAKYVLVSTTGNSKNTLTSVYSVERGQGIDGIVQTIADKCAWGNFYKELVYCAVPSQNVAATYPDDWYTGSVSTADKIWQIDAETGEIHLVSSITDSSDRVIDAFNLALDAKDNFLFFMNKQDLSFWSLDLVEQE